MLRWRLLSAGVILGLLFTLAVLDFWRFGGAPPGAWLFPWLLLITMLATEEVLSLLAAKSLRPVSWPVYVGTALVLLGFALPILRPLWSSSSGSAVGDHWSAAPLIALACGAALVFVAEMRRFERPGQHVVHIALAVFAIVYLGVLGGFLVALRLYQGNNGAGMTALMSMLLVVKSSDAGAYTFGRIFGSTKMTPRLSPSKTIEGAIGGVATACVSSWAFFQFVAPSFRGAAEYVPPSWLATMVYGLVLAIAAIIGDLAESLLKRDMERKDSSTWLPGLGGVLDVIDSILVAAPAAFVCWELGLVG